MKLTVDEIQDAIRAAQSEPGVPLTREQASAAAAKLYQQKVAEDDAAHDAGIIAQIAYIRSSYIPPAGSGIPGSDVGEAAGWRNEGIANMTTALAEDTAAWERNRAIAFGALSAALAVGLGPAASPAAVGAALLPLVGLLQEASK